MRKSVNGNSLIKAKAQVKPAQPVVPTKKPPSEPIKTQFTHSMGLKLQ